MTKVVCSVEGCGRPHSSLGLCGAHRERFRRSGDVQAAVPVRKPRTGGCSIEGCEKRRYSGPFCNAHYSQAFRSGYRANGQAEACSVSDCDRPARSRGYCASHYGLWRQHGTPTPPPKPQPSNKKRSPNRGYVLVKVPAGHPMAMANGYALEHRLAMFEKLGRPLLPTENVHHVNGVRDDNRIENLELWTTAQPSGQRVSEKVAWAMELLGFYSPESLSGQPRASG